MLQFYYRAPWSFDYLRRGPLGSHIDSFAAMLYELAYTRNTALSYISLVHAFSEWLQDRRMKATDLSEKVAQLFIQERGKRFVVRSGMSPLKLMLQHLRDMGIIQAQRTARTKLSFLLQAYEQHLLNDRGLSCATIAYYVPPVRNLLIHCFRRRRIRISQLKAIHVSSFMVRHIKDHGPGWARKLRSALASLLRFLYVTGRTPADLAASLPPVADWQKPLPARLEPSEVNRLLKCCDRKTPKGRRDHAILLLLVRLGLRACEVSTLTLDDIDWKNGEIMVAGKRSRQGRLPLPHDVGKSLAHYIKHVRPRCLIRHVFVRMRAPCTGFKVNSAIGRIVRKALLRANLHPPRRGSHLLRHTCATALIRRGASLSEVGEILRHRNQDTTAIYARVDQNTLRKVAQPWRGGGA